MARKPSSIGKILECFPCSSSSSGIPSCFFCVNSAGGAASCRTEEEETEAERWPLVKSEGGRVMRLKDVLLSDDDQFQTLAFQLRPKTVTLRVSMHCDGCAKKVEKNISKLDGVASYKVDLESKTVIVIGDVLPYEVLHSVSKVIKFAELWSPSGSDLTSPPVTGDGDRSKLTSD